MNHPGQLLKTHNLRASKARGQNFLTQPASAAAIARAANITPEDVVVEIGGGLGALTLALAPLAQRVISLEVDRGLLPVLQALLDEAGAANVEVRLADALDFAWAAEAAAAGRPLVVAGNLPYAISSPLLFALVENRAHWTGATLMVQREVAQRLVAGPGGKDYGRLAVLIQTWCTTRPGMVLGPDQFFPRPAVESQVVHLTPREAPLVAWAMGEKGQWFAQVVKAAFSQRRKTLLNSLAAGLGLEKPLVAAALARAGVDPGRRAEALGIPELGAVAAVLPGAPAELAAPA
ncbi:MAG: 16S rRNA (adenine(1518)-N(6)/adenine(1519)-N(6))-dimethyltransferase RsmA [Pseudomonadota bacterium]